MGGGGDTAAADHCARANRCPVAALVLMLVLACVGGLPGCDNGYEAREQGTDSPFEASPNDAPMPGEDGSSEGAAGESAVDSPVKSRRQKKRSKP